MPVINGIWLPDLSEKQLIQYNCFSRFGLACGPRKSGKTIGWMHKIMRHAVDTDRAFILLVAKNLKSAINGGCWHDLYEMILPLWLNADTGITVHKEQRQDNRTQQVYFEIRNRYGTVSHICLDSLDFEGDAEKKFKGRRFSMVYFNELSNFNSRKVLDVSKELLRCPWLPFEAHQWIADTNPSDEGERSWIHKLWYQDRIADLDAIEDLGERRRLQIMQPYLWLVEIMIEDNPYLSQQEVEELWASYSHDPDLVNRYLKGLWVEASSDSMFSDVFKPMQHVLGSTEGRDPAKWERALPQEDAFELITGWDLGSKYHAVVFLEPWIRGDDLVIKVLDEVVYLNEEVSLEEVVEEVEEKMDFLEGQCDKEVKWRHWSDQSAFDAFRPSAQMYDYQLIHYLSKGRISLKAAPKFKNSVGAEIRMIRRLLHQDRLYVSANCGHVRRMLSSLRSGPNPFMSIAKGTIHKHAFDALAYAISSELPREIDFGLTPRFARPKKVSRLVSV